MIKPCSRSDILRCVANAARLKAAEDERRRLEEALRQAKEAAETANRAKGRFLANMSHEMRTPLNAILGFAQLVLEGLHLPDDLREHVTTISRSGNHLLEIINEILELARIESGRAVLNRVPFDLGQILDDVQRMFSLRAQTQGLRFHVQRHEPLPRYVVGDETKLRQVLINLLGNACKFTPQGGTVVLRVWSTAEPTGQLRLAAEVEDSGVGIASSDLPRLFEPFFQTAAGERAGGSGLGLSISHGFVQLMGGDLTADSQLGRGSRFRFDVQLAPGREGNLATPAASRRPLRLRPGATCRVLVADDQPNNRELLRHQLTPLGFELGLAEDGAEAVAQCRAWSPDVVLMDLRMPVLDGLEATRRIRVELDAKVKIIAISAGALADEQQRALEAGADAFLAKPYQLSDLLDRIRQLAGVEYLYADAPVPEPVAPRPTAAAARRLPAELTQALRLAAHCANYDQLLALVDQVRTLDQTLAAGFRQLVESFDYAALETLLAPQDVASHGRSSAVPLQGRVLLADDDPSVRTLLRLMLTRAGAEVDVAGDGEQLCCLAQAAQADGRPYDLILTDVQMPALDGLAAAARLRASAWPGRIVALTGYASTEYGQRCLEAGCDGYLSKPVSRQDLVDTLARYLPPQPADATASAVSSQ